MLSYFFQDASNEAILNVAGLTLSITLIHYMIDSFPAAIASGITGLYICWRETSTTDVIHLSQYHRR